jgi:hypothetical protein
MDGAQIQKYVQDSVRVILEREATIDEMQEQAEARMREVHEKRSGVRKLEIELGDYVMVEQNTLHKHYPKLMKRWIGPARVSVSTRTSRRRLQWKISLLALRAGQRKRCTLDG